MHLQGTVEEQKVLYREELVLDLIHNHVQNLSIYDYRIRLKFSDLSYSVVTIISRKIVISLFHGIFTNLQEIVHGALVLSIASCCDC